MGTDSGIHIPITFDLRDLPLESTGIVCGVAGRLVGVTSMAGSSTGSGEDEYEYGAGSGSSEYGSGMGRRASRPVEMCYLSTARAGNVMVLEEDLQRTLQALRGAGEGLLGD
jgi:hypothetical protein